jgi:hypothetical protein
MTLVNKESNMSSYELATLYELWDALENVPVLITRQNDVVTDEPFQEFETGTSIEDIWHWFEAQHPSFIVGEVQQGIRRI